MARVLELAITMGMPLGWASGLRSNEATGLSERRGKGENLHTIPLSSNFIPRVAVTPRIVVNGFFRIHLHVLLARASGVEVADGLYDRLALWGEADGALWVGLVVGFLVVAAWVVGGG